VAEDICFVHFGQEWPGWRGWAGRVYVLNRSRRLLPGAAAAAATAAAAAAARPVAPAVDVLDRAALLDLAAQHIAQSYHRVFPARTALAVWP